MKLLCDLALIILVLERVSSSSHGASSKLCSASLSSISSSPHGSSSNKDEAPFQIKVNPSTYTTGTTIKVTLEGNEENDEFKGFIVTAKKKDKTKAGDDKIGTFTTTDDDSQIACDSAAVTHTSAKSKQSVSFEWVAPSAAVGEVVFVATVVRAKNGLKSDYYEGITSEEIAFEGPNPSI